MKLPDLNHPIVLQTDPSGYGLGDVLMQDFDDVLRPVGFARHTLAAAQRNYRFCELECLAILFGVRKVSMYINGARSVIQSDNVALSWFRRLENSVGRLARWVLTLEE